MKPATIVLAGVLALFLPAAVMAQANTSEREVKGGTAQANTSEREVKGGTGRDIRLGVYINIRADCSSGPLPAIRLDSPPAHGAVTVKRAKVQMTGRRDCLAAEVPGFIAFYRSKTDFTGADEVTLEIRTDTGKIFRQKIKITVEDVKARSI